MEAVTQKLDSQRSASNSTPSVGKLRDYLGLIRFSHTIFALPFAGLATIWASYLSWNTATVVANGSTGWTRQLLAWVGILLCMVFARSFAMAWNRLADATIDAKNPRTATRHIPAGILSMRAVTVFAVACALLFITSCTLFLPNYLPLVGAVPVLIWLAGYSYAKRFTSLAHFWLGIALMLAPICAWIALRGLQVQANVSDILPAVLLAREFWPGWQASTSSTLAKTSRSIVSRIALDSEQFGVVGALRIAAICHLLTPAIFGSIIGLCPVLKLGWIWAVALIGIVLLLIYEHRLVRPDDLSRVNVAFFNVNGIISVVLLIAGTLDTCFVN